DVGAGEGEEGHLSAGAAQLIAVEEVVGRDVVLIDGLLDQPHAQDAGKEVDVAAGVAGDRRDVVQSAKPVFHVAFLLLRAVPRRRAGGCVQYPWPAQRRVSGAIISLVACARNYMLDSSHER